MKGKEPIRVIPGGNILRGFLLVKVKTMSNGYVFRPRPYQEEAKQAILKEFSSGRQRTLLVLPTGTGKTEVFCDVLAERLRAPNTRALILAHRDELLSRAAETVERNIGMQLEYLSSLDPEHSTARIVIGSVQTLSRSARLSQFPSDYFTDIVIDEAHHSTAKTYRRILEHFPDAYVLGATATPDRGDHRQLSDIFQSVAYEYPFSQAISDGYLCPIHEMRIPYTIDLRNVRSKAGDFEEAGMNQAILPCLNAIADRIIPLCKGRKTVVFLPLIQTAQAMAALLNERGVKAAEVDCETKNRGEILAAFARGEYEILCNTMLLTEGWNCPAVDCIVNLRPTRRKTLYAQMIGRGMRIYPGKPDLLVLNFSYYTSADDLCSGATLFGTDAETTQAMEKMLKSSDAPQDLTKVLADAQKQVLHKHELPLIRKLASRTRRNANEIDPMSYAVLIHSEKITLYQPVWAWEKELPTEKQMTTLNRFGFDLSSVSTKGFASAVLAVACERSKNGLASPKQLNLLSQGSNGDLAGMTSAEAGAAINCLIQKRKKAAARRTYQTYNYYNNYNNLKRRK